MFTVVVDGVHRGDEMKFTADEIGCFVLIY